MKTSLINSYIQLREKTPLVHSITNMVVMNTTANALLALGASPIMAHASEEVEEMVSLSDALVINIGTLDSNSIKSMLLAAKKANSLGKPWVLDPVGVGASELRNKTVRDLLTLRPTAIRANASEINAIAQSNNIGKGVDSLQSTDEALQSAILLSGQYGSVVCLTGERDFVVHGAKKSCIENGSPLMRLVTGMGCTATALTAAFLGSNQDEYEACVASITTMGVAGELAAELAQGPGTLQLHFYDVLHQLTPEILEERAKL